MVEFPKGSKPVTTTLLDMRTRVVMTDGTWPDGLQLLSNTGCELLQISLQTRIPTTCLP